MSTPRTYIVGGTKNSHRSLSPYDFIVVMGNTIAKENGISDYAIIRRNVEDPDSGTQKNKPLKVYAKVIIDKELDTVEKNYIRMDQTLRNALGMKFYTGEESWNLMIDPVKFSLKNKIIDKVTGWLGKRYLFLRVAKLFPSDIEKQICRVPKDALALLGTSEGNRVVLVSVQKDESKDQFKIMNRTIKAFDLYESMLEERKEGFNKSNDNNENDVEEDDGEGWDARYVNAEKLLNLKQDIAPILLDYYDREKLDVEPGDPIKIRRSFPDLFKNQLLEVGFVLIGSGFALTGLLPEGFKTNYYFWYLTTAIGGSILLSSLALIWRLRAKVR